MTTCCVCAAKYVVSVVCTLLCYDLLNYCWSSFIVVQKGLVCEYMLSDYYDNNIRHAISFGQHTSTHAHAVHVQLMLTIDLSVNFRQPLESFRQLNCTGAVQRSNVCVCVCVCGATEKGEREIMPNHQIISNFFFGICCAHKWLDGFMRYFCSLFGMHIVEWFWFLAGPTVHHHEKAF